MALLLPPGDKTQYRAVGFIRGTYTPLSPECFGKGTLKTSDGVDFPCLLTKISANFFEKHPEKLKEELVFNTWIRSQKDGSLRFQLKNSLCPNKFGLNVDLFSIRGNIQKILNDAIVIRVKRNTAPPEGKEKAWQYKPFVVVLKVPPGNPLLNKKYLGQFWEFQVCRSEGTNELVIENCNFITEAPRKKLKTPSSALSKKEVNSGLKSNKAKPILKKTKVAV